MLIKDDGSRVSYSVDRKLERDDLTSEAAQAAVAFADQQALPRTTLNAAIADALPDGQGGTADLLRSRDKFANFGYVWNPQDADDLWQPGLPSLMDYVCRQA
ncbi:MAG: hypothetical protein F4169_13700 [Gammaproteobacteria bacterium]|nr:hypothetical protein [Gammaproteobacteria bacterium]